MFFQWLIPIVAAVLVVAVPACVRQNRVYFKNKYLDMLKKFPILLACTSIIGFTVLCYLGGAAAIYFGGRFLPIIR